MTENRPRQPDDRPAGSGRSDAYAAPGLGPEGAGPGAIRPSGAPAARSDDAPTEAAGPARTARLASTQLARAVAGASVAAMVLLLDLITFSQLIFAGPLAASLAAGLSAMLAAFVLGSIVFALVRRGPPVSLAFIGAAAIVQASIAAAATERLREAGVADPDVLGASALLVCGATTVAAGAVFTLLGALRASLLAQLLPYPVLTGFLGGVGLLSILSGLRVGARLDGAALLDAPDASGLARLGLTALIGIGAFYLPLRLRHWTVYPAFLLASFAVVHAGLGLAGIDAAAAQAAGWLIDPLPDGSLLRPPAALSIGALDPALLTALAPRIATEVVVAVIVQILYVLSVELDLRRDLDVDRTFVAAGLANLVGGAFGSTPVGFGRTATITLHAIGGGGWLAWSLVVAVMAAILVFGAGPLALLPRPLAGAALIGLGLGITTRLSTACRTISAWESLVMLTVCAATATLGAAPGFTVGIVLAILIFAVQYAQIPAVRRALDGAQRPSSVIRAPDAARALRAAAGGILVYTLQGYLFFLNAQAVCRRAAEAGPRLRFLILDFRECVGLDSSAMVAFRKIAQLAERRGFAVILVHLDASAARQVSRGGLVDPPRVSVLNTLDEALRHAEGTLLAEAGLAVAHDGSVFALHVARTLGCALEPDAFAAYVAPRVLAPGEALVRQGEEADAMFFVESGLVSIELEVPGRPNLRLRTTTAGTVIGEIALVQGGRRTATAVAESPARVVGLGREALARMERERPDLALRLHRFLILELAGKVADTNRLLEAELR